MCAFRESLKKGFYPAVEGNPLILQQETRYNDAPHRLFQIDRSVLQGNALRHIGRAVEHNARIAAMTSANDLQKLNPTRLKSGTAELSRAYDKAVDGIKEAVRAGGFLDSKRVSNVDAVYAAFGDLKNAVVEFNPVAGKVFILVPKPA